MSAGSILDPRLSLVRVRIVTAGDMWRWTCCGPAGELLSKGTALSFLDAYERSLRSARRWARAETDIGVEYVRNSDT